MLFLTHIIELSLISQRQKTISDLRMICHPSCNVISNTYHWDLSDLTKAKEHRWCLWRFLHLHIWTWIALMERVENNMCIFPLVSSHIHDIYCWGVVRQEDLLSGTGFLFAFVLIEGQRDSFMWTCLSSLHSTLSLCVHSGGAPRHDVFKSRERTWMDSRI